MTDRPPFRRILPPVRSPPGDFTTIPFDFILKDAFRLHTLLALGAAAQLTLAALARPPWCYVPVATLLGLAAGRTLLQLTIGRFSHTFLANIVLGRATAQPPWPSTSSSVASSTASSMIAARPVVVFHFGARFNHPLGLLAPGGSAVTAYFRNMVHALQEDRCRGAIGEPTGSYGLLGAQLFRGAERGVHATLLVVLYFRDVAGLQRFAQSPLHREGQRWLQRAGHPHIGVFHETFVVPAGAYESVYINAAPTLLGATHYARASEQGAQKQDSAHAKAPANGTSDSSIVWETALVDADDVRLRTMAARLHSMTNDNGL